METPENPPLGSFLGKNSSALFLSGLTIAAVLQLIMHLCKIAVVAKLGLCVKCDLAS